MSVVPRRVPLRAALYLVGGGALLVATALAAQADFGLGSPGFNAWGIAEAENYTRPYVGSPCEPSPASEHTRPWLDPSASNGYYAFTGHSPCGFIYDDMPFPTTGQFDRIFFRSGGSVATINVLVEVRVDGVLTAQTTTPMTCCQPFVDIALSPVGPGTVTAGVHDVDVRFTRLPGGDFHNYEVDCFKFEETDLGPCSPPPPTSGLAFGPANPCVGEAVGFTDLSLAGHALVPLREGTWDFGDGTTTTFNPWTGSATSHTYATAGTYTVTLQVEDVRDRVATATQVVEVTHCPAADFGCLGIDNPYLRVLFSDATVDLDGDIVGRRWEFGDGAVDDTNATTPIHDYAAEGWYNVTLTVTDARGHVATATRACYADLNLPPVLDPLPRPVVFEGETILFVVTASDPDNDPLVFTWGPGPVASLGDFDPATQRFLWATGPGQAGTYEPVTFAVRDLRHTVSATTRMVVRPMPEDPAPDSADSDHDGVIDRHDPCPADPAGCGEVPGSDGGTDDASADTGGDAGGLGQDPAACAGTPRPAEARAAPTLDGGVRVAWRLDAACAAIDHFLVWAGVDGPAGLAADAFVARVPYVPGQRLYETRNADPPLLAHRYHVAAVAAGAPDVQDPALAVASNLIDPAACRRDGERAPACLPDGSLAPLDAGLDGAGGTDGAASSGDAAHPLHAAVPVAVGTFSALLALGILLLLARLRRTPGKVAGW